MSSLNEEVFKILKALDEQKALEHLVVIGSWAVPFYQAYFNDPSYNPTIRTTDIDFLIPKKSFRGFRLDLSKSLKDLGFVENFSSDGWVTYSKPDLDVQFICPRIGQPSNKPQSVPELGVNARQLPHMSELGKTTIQCHVQGINVLVPHPVTFALHKLIISTRRKNVDKRDNDRQQAEMVLTTLSDPKDIAFLNQSYSTLTKKEKKYISEATEGRPLVQEMFRDRQVLTAEALNQLYSRIENAYTIRGFKLRKKTTWKDGSILHARELNVLIDCIDELYEHMKMVRPQWSFGRFKDRTVLKAAQLNEIDRRLKELPVRKTGATVKVS